MIMHTPYAGSSSANPEVEKYDAVCSRHRGFTLVEIMAATGIMLALIMLVMTLTGRVLNAWSFSSGRLEQNYEARIAMSFLAEDLESAVFRNNGDAWLEVVYSNVGQATYTAQNQTELYFFSQVTDRPSDELGGVSAVAYLTEFQNPFTEEVSTDPGNPPPPVFGLYRCVIDAPTTFNNVIGTVGTDLANNTFGTGLNATDSEYYLSANVVDFQVIFYAVFDSDQTNDGGDVIATAGDVVPITTDYSINSSPQDFYVADGQIHVGGAPQSGHLVYADVKLTVLGAEGGKIVGTGSTDGLAWDDFKDTYGETFTRRIYIMSKTL
ncbi:prepilin-type N-terminal cleavage/methylation domain-containing protein [Ruficoccus sp. ZRK36]|uniref:PulJ/GspJ family protein n=1 Tax=Ruficoccus sp. ZRK36 TaxID=2866311 RepID=UPI001C7374F3|nr:prepilin-type N-terminal cleavage/methylation domain-containing protein [Ruficoccus sp. ZRK36]QYY37057.1 prepilin-type N-terminal cleavage/methylation domain-containing protein [Ruficoccus sp. ZRK36]